MTFIRIKMKSGEIFCVSHDEEQEDYIFNMVIIAVGKYHSKPIKSIKKVLDLL